MKLASLVLIIALALSSIAVGLSAIKTTEPAGGYVAYGTWVSTFNIIDSAVTTSKIANAAITDVKLANAKVNLSGDTITGNVNMTNKTLTAVGNITFSNTSQAYITWNGTALIIRVP